MASRTPSERLSGGARSVDIREGRSLSRCQFTLSRTHRVFPEICGAHYTYRVYIYILIYRNELEPGNSAGDPFGMFFVILSKANRDLQIGDEKVILNHLEYHIYHLYTR